MGGGSYVAGTDQRRKELRGDGLNAGGELQHGGEEPRVQRRHRGAARARGAVAHHEENDGM